MFLNAQYSLTSLFFNYTHFYQTLFFNEKKIPFWKDANMEAMFFFFFFYQIFGLSWSLFLHCILFSFHLFIVCEEIQSLLHNNWFNW